MVYLADWKNTLECGKQITNINWYFDNYGPFVRDVETKAKANDNLFSIMFDANIYGQAKKIFKLKNNNILTNLDENERRSIASVVEETWKLYWKDFIKLVYSTHPVASSDRYTYLDLVSKAKEYKTIKEIRQNRV